MKYLSFLTALLFLSFSVSANDSIKTLIEEKGLNVDADCVSVIFDSYKKDIKKANTYFMVPDTYDTSYSKISVNGFWVFSSRYIGLIAYLHYCEDEKGDCYIIPEHPGVDLDTELINRGNHFDHVPKVKEKEYRMDMVPVRSKEFNIESGDIYDHVPEVNKKVSATFEASCDVNNPSSLCKLMAEEKAKRSVERMTSDNKKHRNSLEQCDYEWQHGLNEIVKIRSSDLQDIDNGEIMLDELFRQVSQLAVIVSKYRSLDNKYNQLN